MSHEKRITVEEDEIVEFDPDTGIVRIGPECFETHISRLCIVAATLPGQSIEELDESEQVR